MRPFIICYLLAGLVYAKAMFAQSAAQIAFLNEEGRMEYTPDQQYNFIVDFSYAGYKNGTEAIPQIPIIKTIQAVAGDNTSHIQQAIDEAAAIPLNANGIRGTILLESGVYDIHGVIRLNVAGLVLSGKGQGADPASNTILRAVGNSPSKRALIIVGTDDHEKWKEAIPGTRTKITSSFLPAGTRSLEVEDLSPFQVGDQVIVFQPSTEDWLASINYGDTDSDDPWEPGQVDILYNRTIQSISEEEQKIILSVPIYDHLDRSLAQAEIYILDEPNTIRKSGVENFRIKIDTDGEEDESHAWNGVRFEGVEDCWAKDITVLHFAYAAIYTYVANRVSILNCSGLEPHSKVDGARRYNFATNEFSNNILFQNCRTTWGRHSYVSNGKSAVSGIVFHQCQSEHDYTASEGHRMWSQALLFDNITFTNPEGQQLMGMYNRGSWGDSHGWGAVHSVAWNVAMEPNRELILQQPPGRQNYAIGCKAIVKNDYVYDHDRGYEESTGTFVQPSSLYAAQLHARQHYGAYADAPIDLEATYNNENVLLSWKDMAGDETGYVVFLSKDGGNTFQKLVELPKNTTAYTHDIGDLEDGLLYKVASVRNTVLSPWSNSVALGTVSGNDNNVLSAFEVYPNPASTEVQLYAEAGLISVVVVDMLGRPMSGYNNVSTIDVSAWPPSVYLLRLQDEQEQVYYYKLVKE
jgi:Secretion system C-terminal sorting domain